MFGGRDVVVPIYDPDSRRQLHEVTLQSGADLTDYIHTLPDGRTGALCVASKLDAQTLLNKDEFGIAFCIPYSKDEWMKLTTSDQLEVALDSVLQHPPAIVNASGPPENMDKAHGLVDSASIAAKLGRYTFYIDPLTDRLVALDHRTLRPQRFDPTTHDQIFFHERYTNEQFDIVVKSLTGKRITCRVSPDTTIFELKQLIYDKEGIPPEQQRFIFAGKQLLDAETFRTYGIGENAVVDMVLRLRGGMHHVSSARSDYDDMYLKAHGTRVEWGIVDVAVRTCDGRETTVSISQLLDADDLKRQIANLNRLCTGIATGGRSPRSARASSFGGDSIASQSSWNSSRQSGGRDFLGGHFAPKRPSGWRRL
jgi:ubiquitin